MQKKKPKTEPQEDSPLTAEDESLDITSKIDEPVEDNIETPAKEEVTDEDFSKLYNPANCDEEDYNVDEKKAEPEKQELMSDVEISLEESPEDEKEHFYQKHIKKNYRLLHPNEENL
jgi:hypothetical protein